MKTYRLNRRYALRGWKGMSGALLDGRRLHAEGLSRSAFCVLLLCDGKTGIDTDLLTEEERGLLAGYIEKGIVESCDGINPISEKQCYRFYDNRYAESVFWSITGRCNYACRHCYMDAPNGAYGELTHEEAMTLIDQMAECGVMRVDITGGEPFVRSDFWELTDAIMAHGIRIGTVYTNGRLLTDEVLGEFEKRGFKPEISISFDGVGWHDWLRGVEGAEADAIRALKRCRDHGFLTDVEMCVHKGNIGTICETVRLLSEIGVHAVKIGRISDTERWKKYGGEYALSYEEYVKAAIDYIPRYYEDDLPISVMLCDICELRTDEPEDYDIIPERYIGGEQCGDCYLCKAMRMSCYIAPDGRLLPCMPFTSCQRQMKFERVQDIGLKQALSGSWYMRFIDKRVRDIIAENPQCAGCEHRYVCGGGCRASAMEKTGEYMGVDPNQCFLWKNGYVEQIKNAVEKSLAEYGKTRGKT